MSLIKILYFAYISLYIAHISCNLATNYGEFDLHVDKFNSCKGPKNQDCSVVTSTIADGKVVLYDIIIKENMKPTKGKIVAMSKGKQLVRLQVDDPCDHLFLRPLFQTLFRNVTDDCVILKGHYSFNVDLEKIAKSYYQGSFIYGKLTFKSVFYNNDCNLSCALVEVTTSPKQSTANPD